MSLASARAKACIRAMYDAAKLAREKDLERYDLFPAYPTGKFSFFNLDL